MSFKNVFCSLFVIGCVGTLSAYAFYNSETRTHNYTLPSGRDVGTSYNPVTDQRTVWVSGPNLNYYPALGKSNEGTGQGTGNIVYMSENGNPQSILFVGPQGASAGKYYDPSTGQVNAWISGPNVRYNQYLGNMNAGTGIGTGSVQVHYFNGYPVLVDVTGPMGGDYGYVYDPNTLFRQMGYQ